jgi:hypothetical protein
LQCETQVTSDSAALHTLVDALLEGTRKIRCMRDPTRGGLSSTLNEIAASSRVGMELEETAIPVREEVRGACENVGVGPAVRGQRRQAGGDCRGFSGAGCVARVAGSSAGKRHACHRTCNCGASKNGGDANSVWHHANCPTCSREISCRASARGYACTRSASPPRSWKRWTQKLASVLRKNHCGGPANRGTLQHRCGCAHVCV